MINPEPWLERLEIFCGSCNEHEESSDCTLHTGVPDVITWFRFIFGPLGRYPWEKVEKVTQDSEAGGSNYAFGAISLVPEGG